MKPETRTVTQLFELAVRYVVPCINDPTSGRKGRSGSRSGMTSSRCSSTRRHGGSAAYSHFLGAIVLEQETQAPGEIPVFTVIDGQQRLTTLQISSRPLSNVAASSGATTKPRSSVISSATISKKAAGDELYKVWPTNANRAAFKAVMSDGGPPTNHQDDPNNRIDEAYAFFAAQSGG